MNTIPEPISNRMIEDYTEYETDTDSQYDSDTDDESYNDNSYDYDYIWEAEEEYDDQELIHKNYYIGTYKIIKSENILLFVNHISLKTFLKYSANKISKYFYWYSGLHITKTPPVEIIQLYIQSDGTYTGVLKTFWIKIIQRCWKRTYKQLQEVIQQRKRIAYLRMFEISGKYLGGNQPYYGLRGMLSEYNNKL